MTAHNTRGSRRDVKVPLLHIFGRDVDEYLPSLGHGFPAREL